MTPLAAFISEGQARGNPCTPDAVANWDSLVELFRRIDISTEPAVVELRRALEKVATQVAVPYLERTHAMIPFLRPFMPDKGGTVH